MLRFLARVLLTSWGMLSWISCAPVSSIDPQSSVADGLAGKSWGEVYALEPAREFDLSASSAEKRTFNDFALTSTGDHLYLAGTFYDDAIEKYQGVIRTYQSEQGWGGEGSGSSGFTDSSQNFDHVGLISSSAGEVLALFSRGGAGPTPMTSVLGRNGGWLQTWSVNLSDLPEYPDATERLSLGPVYQGAFDPLGQVRFALGFEKESYEYLYQRSHHQGVIEELKYDAAEGSSTTASHLILSDGVGTTCQTFENRASPSDARSLQIACRVFAEDTIEETELVASAEYEQLETLGHDGASDGQGLLVYIAYREIAGEWVVTANTVLEGAVSDPVEISAGMTELGYSAAAAESAEDWNQAARPRIVYLGNHRFLVVWQGVAALSSGGKVSQLFSAVYNSWQDEWSQAEPIGEERAYSVLPAHYGFSLFANQDDNAGVAINRVDADTGQVHTLEVARFHEAAGWQEFNEFGAGCDASVSLRQCSMTPQGAILNTGQTVVAFVDQDEEGVFRLMGVNFE